MFPDFPKADIKCSIIPISNGIQSLGIWSVFETAWSSSSSTEARMRNEEDNSRWRAEIQRDRGEFPSEGRTARLISSWEEPRGRQVKNEEDTLNTRRTRGKEEGRKEYNPLRAQSAIVLLFSASAPDTHRPVSISVTEPCVFNIHPHYFCRPHMFPLPRLCSTRDKA